MTAAHCISSLDAALYRVVVGEYNLFEYDGSEQFVRVEKIIVHPEWNGDLGNGNDIALLKLANPIYDNGFVEIANLPAPNEMLPHDFTCYITGWGLIGYNKAVVPDILQVAPINVVEHSVCSRPDWWGSLALQSMVCAGGDGYISGCQGDSGGPLSCFTDGVWRVHGVVSYGPAGVCNQVSKPTVFTRVSYFEDWLFSAMSTS
uniref:Chymotrypsin-like elastase family member 2A n=2 Tax=Gouania willdenowi TaxID=441366 RepID=A0A8C5NGH5_GOUWI